MRYIVIMSFFAGGTPYQVGVSLIFVDATDPQGPVSIDVAAPSGALGTSNYTLHSHNSLRASHANHQS